MSRSNPPTSSEFKQSQGHSSKFDSSLHGVGIIFDNSSSRCARAVGAALFSPDAENSNCTSSTLLRCVVNGANRCDIWKLTARRLRSVALHAVSLLLNAECFCSIDDSRTTVLKYLILLNTNPYNAPAMHIEQRLVCCFLNLTVTCQTVTLNVF